MENECSLGRQMVGAGLLIPLLELLLLCMLRSWSALGVRGPNSRAGPGGSGYNSPVSPRVSEEGCFLKREG